MSKTLARRFRHALNRTHPSYPIADESSLKLWIDGYNSYCQHVHANTSSTQALDISKSVQCITGELIKKIKYPDDLQTIYKEDNSWIITELKKVHGSHTLGPHFNLSIVEDCSYYFMMCILCMNADLMIPSKWLQARNNLLREHDAELTIMRNAIDNSANL